MACQGFNKISKKTVVAMTTPSILDSIEEDDWTITSFDQNTGQVCIDLQNNFQTLHLIFTLPNLKNPISTLY